MNGQMIVVLFLPEKNRLGEFPKMYIFDGLID